jgi:hypothetical protein
MFPFDWYWAVAGSTTQVYSSKRLEYVPVSDSAFVAWKLTFGMPSQIATEAEMLSILSMFGL